MLGQLRRGRREWNERARERQLEMAWKTVMNVHVQVTAKIKETPT